MYKIVIDLQKLTLDDLIGLEDGANYRTLRQLIGRFVVDGAGNPVGTEQAEKFAGGLTIDQIKEVNVQIKDTLSGSISPETSGG